MSRWLPQCLAGAVVVAGVLCTGHAAYSHLNANQPLGQASDRVPVLSSNTNLVAVPVNVVDNHGDFVAGLTADNFHVYEDGRAQSVSFFEQEDTPVTVGLLVDHSGSMDLELPEVAAAVVAFAHSSNPEDEMFVIDFDDRVTVELLHGKPFTSDAQELEQAVTAVSASGRTALYDAVMEGFVHLKLGQWNKKALIIVSDGGDNVSRNDYSHVLETARSSHVVIYAIGLLSKTSHDENPGVLRRLCRDTGGIAYFPTKGDSIQKISRQIARDLRTQYMLAYDPPKVSDGNSFRRIDVKVSVPGRRKVRVRSRTGYAPVKSSPIQGGGGAP